MEINYCIRLLVISLDDTCVAQSACSIAVCSADMKIWRNKLAELAQRIETAHVASELAILLKEYKEVIQTSENVIIVLQKTTLDSLDEASANIVQEVAGEITQGMLRIPRSECLRGGGRLSVLVDLKN